MNKENFELNDKELDNISAGAGQTIYRIEEREDGKYNVYTGSFEGDLDALKKVLEGGSVSKLNFSGDAGKFIGLSTDKLEGMKKKFSERGYILVE